jgi:peptide/nickel transport system substrate-binding protein
MKRQIFQVLSVLLLAFGVAGLVFAGGGAEGRTQAEPKVFVYANSTTFPDINPATGFSNDIVITAQVYETLTFYNPPGSEEVISPRLATRWEANDDSTVWTFEIRRGVTFHDGEPLNAQAVKDAIDNTMEIGAGASYIWAPVESIEVVDEYTVRFNLEYPAPLDIVASAGYQAGIYSMKAYEQHGPDWFNAGNTAGTGPYIIDSYQPGSRLVMKRFDDYWGGWSDDQFDIVVYEVIEDPVVRQQMITAGTADFTFQTPPDNLPALDARPDVTVYTNPSFQNLVGLFNTLRPPLDDVRVRKALSYSFPYDQFMEAIMGDRAIQATGPVPADLWGHKEDLYQYSYDLERARQLLREAGHGQGGFELLYTYATGDLDQQQIGELWKAELAKLNINLRIQAMTWESQWDLALSDPENAQDVFVMYWWPDYVTPTTFLFNMFVSSEEPLFNLAYYENPEFDELVFEADALTGTDIDEASQLFGQAQEILVEDAVALYFYDLANTHVVRSDITGYVDNPAYPHVVFPYDLGRK